MEQVTIAVAAAGVLLVMWLKPSQGLAVYLASVMFYSTDMFVPVGSLNFTVGRIVVAALLVRTFTVSKSTEPFRWNIIDTLVLLLFAWGAFALMVTVGGVSALENQAGHFMDTVLVYFAARLALRRKADLIALAKAISVLVIILAALGVAESLTSWSPYTRFRILAAARRGRTYSPEPRDGFYRAAGAGGNSIVFGMMFVFLMPPLLTLYRAVPRWRFMAALSLGAAVAGAWSSNSAGPFMFVMTFGACALLIKKPELVKPILVGFLLLCVAAELGSNRRFYHLISYMSLGGAWWHRARLIDLAIAHIGEYWALGYGWVDPGWGRLIDGRAYTDITNHYILLAVRHGILAPVLFTGVLYGVIARLRRVYLRLAGDPLSDGAWYMASMFVAAAITLWSVGLLGVAGSLFYLFSGIAAGPLFESERIARRRRLFKVRTSPLAVETSPRT